MAHLITNLENIYTTYFQPSYNVNDNRTPVEVEGYGKITNKPDRYKTSKGMYISEPSIYLGREVFLPVTLESGEDKIKLECCTIRITSKKTIIRTAVAERVGTIKEQFNVGDYIFTIKGVLIAKNGQFPDEEILTMKRIYESTKGVNINNALIELFYSEAGSRAVAIESIEFPEVQGKGMKHRPFVLTCETDFVTTLQLTE